METKKSPVKSLVVCCSFVKDFIIKFPISLIDCFWNSKNLVSCFGFPILIRMVVRIIVVTPLSKLILILLVLLYPFLIYGYFEKEIIETIPNPEVDGDFSTLINIQTGTSSL